MIMIRDAHDVTEFVNGRVKRRGSTELRKFRTKRVNEIHLFLLYIYLLRLFLLYST